MLIPFDSLVRTGPEVEVGLGIGVATVVGAGVADVEGVAVGTARGTGVGVTTLMLADVVTVFACAFFSSFVFGCNAENGRGRDDETPTMASSRTATVTNVQPIVYLNAVPIE